MVEPSTDLLGGGGGGCATEVVVRAASWLFLGMA